MSLELLFYSLCPFLVKLKSRYLFVLIGLSLGLRWVLINVYGLANDPWGRFFPTEIIYFLFGILFYRLYLYLIPKRILHLRWFSVSALAFLLVFTITFLSLAPHIPKLLAVDYLSVFVFTPVIFSLTKNMEWDRLVGELSYPIYISHLLIHSILKWIDIEPTTGNVILVSSVAAVPLYRFVILPIDRWREANAQSAAKT